MICYKRLRLYFSASLFKSQLLHAKAYSDYKYSKFGYSNNSRHYGRCVITTIGPTKAAATIYWQAPFNVRYGRMATNASTPSANLKRPRDGAQNVPRNTRTLFHLNRERR